jgi:hypothetical protein
MKEDILEQLVDDYLKFNGFFTAHNVKFQPAKTHAEYIKKDDCVASDVDVIGFHPKREGTDRYKRPDDFRSGRQQQASSQREFGVRHSGRRLLFQGRRQRRLQLGRNHPRGSPRYADNARFEAGPRVFSVVQKRADVG